MASQAVIQWFADRADLIIIMFDAHKLDISDELRVVMDALRIHQVRFSGQGAHWVTWSCMLILWPLSSTFVLQDKIRILLNKADTIDSQQLMRVYGVSNDENPAAYRVR